MAMARWGGLCPDLIAGSCLELGMVGWFGDGWAPCLIVTVFENTLVTSSLARRLCATNCKDEVQQAGGLGDLRAQDSPAPGSGQDLLGLKKPQTKTSVAE